MMDDSTPLYGEDSRGQKVMVWLVIIVISLWAVYCAVLGIVYGVLVNIGDLLLAACVILSAVSSLLLWRWWRQEDLNPKFRVLLVMLVVQVLLLGVTMHVYVFVNRTPPAALPVTCLENPTVDFNSFFPVVMAKLNWLQGNASAGLTSCLRVNDCGPGFGYDFRGAGNSPNQVVCRQFVVPPNTTTTTPPTAATGAPKRDVPAASPSAAVATPVASEPRKWNMAERRVRRIVVKSKVAKTA